MRKLIKPRNLLAACAIAATPVASQAQTWAQWALPTDCATYTSVSGVFGAGTVNFATSAGAFNGVQNGAGARCGSISENGNGDNFFNLTAPYNPTPDNKSFVQIDAPLTGRIAFSSAVVDPYIALISVGRTNESSWVNYTFSSPFTIVSDNNPDPAYWGSGIGVDLGGNVFQGREFSGVLQFTGTFTTLDFSTAPGEYWHGFTVGADKLEIGAVDFVAPEPSTYALMAAGLAGLGIAARRRRQA